jgi:hypothetical protein
MDLTDKLVSKRQNNQLKARSRQAHFGCHEAGDFDKKPRRQRSGIVCLRPDVEVRLPTLSVVLEARENSAGRHECGIRRAAAGVGRWGPE